MLMVLRRMHRQIEDIDSKDILCREKDKTKCEE